MKVRIACLMLVVALSAACSGGGNPSPKSSDDRSTASYSPTPLNTPTQSPAVPSSTSPQTTGTADPQRDEATDRAAVEAAWKQYWEVYLSLETKYPKDQWKSVVGSVSVDPIYSQVIQQASTYSVEHIETFGYIVYRPSWPTPIAGSSTAVMRDCYDGTHAGSRYTQSGEQRSIGEARTNTKVTFAVGTDHKWRVQQIEYLKGAC